MRKLWNLYKNYIEEKYLNSFDSKAKDIVFWRARLFTSFMLYTIPIGFLVYIPSMIMSFLGDVPFVAIIDTLAILMVLLLVFNQKIELQKKKIILAICFYSLSIVLLVFIGSMGPGLVYLLGVSIFMVLVISSKAGYVSIFINIGIYCLLTIGLLVPKLDFMFFNDYSFGAWITVGANFLFINTITVVSLSTLLNGLQKTILNEKKLQSKLKIESNRLKVAKDKAVQSDKLKSAFLANMSHEIRTPLNAIVGFASILLKQNEPEAQKKYINIINESSAQLLTLINDIIDLSKIKAGAITLIHERIKLIDFLQILVRPMSNLCPKKLKFEYFVAPSDKEKTLVIDIQKVIQIITNLLTNSFKYTDEGYVKLDVGLTSDKKTINIKVEDTGIGIAVNKQEQVFERFYQENTMVGGVGLGLAICSSLVKTMDGRIYMESEEDKGTTFFVSIPNNSSNNIKVPVYTIEKTQKINLALQNLKILIAEDNDTNFDVVKEILEGGKHLITRAINGNEAVSHAKNKSFDIVLMDLKMPLLDGFEATRQIRQFDKNTPIIALTAYAFDSDEEKALIAGCNDYLAKPIDCNKFNQFLNKYAKAKAD